MLSELCDEWPSIWVTVGRLCGCYGSLTSFNVLFADEADQFKGSGGD